MVARAMRHTLRSMISRFFASSSFFRSASGCSASSDRSAGGAAFSAFFSASVASVDCHRWNSRGASGRKFDGWRVLLDRSDLGHDAGVDMGLVHTKSVETRLCLIRVLRIMIFCRGVRTADEEDTMLMNDSTLLQKFR